MNRFFIVLLMSFALLSGCSDEEDILPSQRKKITDFLKSSHSPALIPESEVDQAGSATPAFYTEAGNTVYRYISNFYAPGRESQPEAQRGSKVLITFRAYVFTAQRITDTTVPYFTNDPALQDFLYDEAGLTPGAWSFEPLEITLGSTEILKGLQLALLGCREGDEVEAFMTYNLAYGDGNFSVIPKESPVEIDFEVLSVMN